MIRVLHTQETGSTAVYDSTTTGSQWTLAVDATSALHGGYGLRCTKAGGALGTLGAYVENTCGSAASLWRGSDGSNSVMALPIGFTFYHRPATLNSTQGPIGNLLELYDSSTLVCAVRLQDTMQTYYVVNNAGTTVTTGFSPTAGTTYRIEGVVTTTGFEVTIYTETGTSAQGAASVALTSTHTQLSSVRMGYRQLISRTNEQVHYFDDLMICDKTATNLLAESGQQTGIPGTLAGLAGSLATGAGTYTQFTPSAGSNYQNIDDALPWPPNTTDYNTTPTGGAFIIRDSFALANYGGANTMKAVSVFAYSRGVTDGVADGANHAVGLHDGTNDHGRAAPAAGTSWTYRGQHCDKAPSNAAWTNTLYDGVELLYKRDGGGADNQSIRDFSGIIALPVDNHGGTVPDTPTAQRRRGLVI